MTNDLKYPEEVKDEAIERCLRLGAPNAKKPRKIYLAAPYSARLADGTIDYPKIFERFQLINKMAGQLMQAGLIVFSPISHSHPIAEAIGDHLNHDFWLAQDFEFVKWADEIWVYKLPGHETSTGIKRELALAEKLCKPVRYLEGDYA